jgi:hypothetical protein
MKTADDANLKVAVAGAQRLLHYASIKGIDVPAELLTHVVGAQALLGRQVDDASTFKEQEIFWSALSKLSALTKPATIESVRHADEEVEVFNRFGALWAKLTGSAAPAPLKVSTSEMAVRTARWWALIGLLLVAMFQAYYEVGQTTTTKFIEATGVIGTESDRVRDLTRNLTRAEQANVADEEVNRITHEIARSNLKVAEASEQTGRRVHWMKLLLFWHVWPQVDVTDGQAVAAEAQSVLSILEGWLGLLRNFVLPIAWSFLGAALYVSRALAEDIRTVAYVPERAILHRSRYYMGMVAGFIAAKFFPASTGVDFGDVTPFAVALLVGYSVEVLFALLDRLISAFSTK